MKQVRRWLAAAVTVCLMAALLPLPAARAASAEQTLDSISAQARYAPGSTAFGAGGCWNFVNEVSQKLFGVSVPGGVSAYQLTGVDGNANWFRVGMVHDGGATNDAVRSLLQQAQAGDLIQYKCAYTNPQHTAMVYRTDGSGITLYDSVSSGVRKYTASWSALFSQIGNFGGVRGYGLSLYRCTKNVAQACTSHVKGSYLWCERAHPHNNYYTCANCGASFADGTTETLSSCATCTSAGQTAPPSIVYLRSLNYDANGGTGAPADSIVSSTSPSVPATVSQTVPVRDGYRFLGWATEKAADTATVQPGAVISLHEGLTLYAVWQRQVAQSTVTVRLYPDVDPAQVTLTDEGGDAIAVTALGRASYAFNAPVGEEIRVSNTLGLRTPAVVEVTRADGEQTTGVYALSQTHRFTMPEGGAQVRISLYTQSVEPAYTGALEHGTIVSTGARIPGEQAHFSADADTGYQLETVRVTDADGARLRLTQKDGRYTYTMPESDVTITAAFVRQTVQLPFGDVSESDWFYDAVCDVYRSGYMAGASGTRFAPGEQASRGMVVTILYRLEGEPKMDRHIRFDDVAIGSYYEYAIQWAARAGVAAGYEMGVFGPDDAITREQLATILYRYDQRNGGAGLPQGTTYLTGFYDAVEISDFALTPMKWAAATGLITGEADGRLDPQGTATRAQLAVILTRYLEG